MNLAKELVDQQIFFRRELSERVGWLVGVRWIAVVTGYNILFAIIVRQENVRQEGFSSMICLPLKVEKRVLGVFCVYSQARFNFSDPDVDFFALIAELTALAIQNLQDQLDLLAGPYYLAASVSC